MPPSTSPRVLGVDLALTRTGVARADGRFATIVAKGKPGDYTRHWTVATELLTILEEDRPDIVVLEDYSHHSPGVYALIAAAEVNGIVRALLQRRRQPFALVPPSTLKLFAVGRGNAPKPELADAALTALYEAAGVALIERARVPDNYDEADAYWLRRMGAARYGLIDEQRPRALEALNTVAWPDLP